jgi:hypothetical protein
MAFVYVVTSLLGKMISEVDAGLEKPCGETKWMTLGWYVLATGSITYIRCDSTFNEQRNRVDL